MDNNKYRVALVKCEEEYKTYLCLCDDEDINVDDNVMVADEKNTFKVIEISFKSELSLQCPIKEMKRVLSKVRDNNQESQEDNLEESINSEEKLQEEIEMNIKNFRGIKAMAKVDAEFSYIDYHADCLMKVKDGAYSTNYSLIKEISLINHTDNNYNNLLVRISFSNDIFRMNDIRIEASESFEEYKLRIPFLKVDKQKLELITERESASLKIDLIDELNSSIISSEEYSFVILPVSQPSRYIIRDNRLYAKFITPLAPKVKQIALNAVKFNKGNSIVTYQNSGKDKYNCMLEEAQSIYLALHEWGIAYQNPPAGGFFTQRIRTPEEVLKDKKGTCIDLAILFCSCLEEVGFNSILVLIDGHAFAGFFLEENLNYPNAIEYQCGKVYNSASGGMNEVVLVECTAFTASTGCSFKQAIEQGLSNIKMYEGKTFSAIDVNLAHRGIFSPISTQGNDEDLELLIKPKEIENKELDSIVETKYVDVLREEEKDRFTFWERKLLDLTESNPLVNFRLKSTNCLKMTCDTKIYDLLIEKETVKFECIPLDSSKASLIENEFIKGTTKPSDIFGNDFDKDKILAIGFEKTLKNIIKKSNSAMDETGAPTLYLCLGVLTYNRKKGQLKGHAPFMVLPIRITKDKLGPFYTINYDYDDVMINQTFFEYYKQEHPGVDFGELYQVNSSDKYMDIVHTFKSNNSEDIQLDENSFFVANLTFAHYIMWQDVRKRKKELKKNKVIQSILENKNLLEDKVETDDIKIDEIERYKNFAAPLYYDSTQLKAILKCGEGKSFILDGPPGTGKSQTIVNMIVNAFYHGKTVLFVAEKKAALDVVADRLRKLGDSNSENNLGRFCLELHSNKANKTEFFEKLKSSMELGATKNPENFEQTCNELEERRSKVLLTINKMHDKKYYYSLYEAIVRQNELKDYKYNYDFDETYLLSLTDEKRQQTYNLIDTYKATADHLNDFDNNPLKVLKVDNINYYDREYVVREFSEVKESLVDLIQAYNEMMESFEVKFPLEQESIKIIMETIDLCLNKNLYLDSIAEFSQNVSDELNQTVFNRSKRFIELKKELLAIFNIEELSNIDAELALNELENTKGFFHKLRIKKKWKKILKNIILPTHKFNKKELMKYYEYIFKFNLLLYYLENNCKLVSAMTNLNYMNEIENVYSIEENYNNTRKFLNNLNKLAIDNKFNKVYELFSSLYIQKNPLFKISYSFTLNKMKKYMELESNLCSKYNIDYKKYDSFKGGLTKFNLLLEYASNENNFNELIDISQINKISKELSDIGLNGLLDSIIEDKFKYKDLKEIYDLSCVDGYIKMYFKDDDINYFNPSTFELEVKKYKSLIDEYNNLVISCVSSKLAKNLNHNNINYANSSPIGRLKKSISNNGRGVTIRDTLLNYDDIIKRYFPCFLMSPLSAAQYLAVDENGGRAVSKFDLVIFDEASQIPTHEAVGPIARGKSLIVAGDPEQMPPSAYFSAGLELAEDEVQYEDAVSLLDECIAIELPRIRLSYHYRSKHESLISFSNHNFYHDNLYTFPSPNTENSLVEFNFVELKEDKKDSSITKEEIDAICSKFKDVYTNEKTKQKSIGIIVFNMKQQEKVYDAITELLSKDKKLNTIVEAAIEKTKEPWFVKSLENVQGDERDIIVLSIGFRKNAAGRAVVIGPIARENGQRRLNVAVSRSKEKMIVISTVKHTDFDEDSKIKNKGQLMLKQFLRFSEENTFKACGDSSLEKGTIIYFIKKDLEDKGFNVVSNVGNSEFKVDLAIMNKKGDLYELGILIDSKSLGNEISCRDKLYVQESLLNALKWKIISIYSLEYFKDRKGTIDKIIKAIDTPYVKEEHHINARIEKEAVEEFRYNSEKYVKALILDNIYYDNENGYGYGIREMLSRIVSFESPVSFETIKTRIREHSNIQNMSAKAKQRLEEMLEYYEFKCNIDQGQLVYWKDDMDFEIEKFRTNSNRDLYDIPKEEILCAMNQILDIQGKISKEDLFRFTLDAFGYGQSVLNKKNQERLEYVYSWARKYNKILVDLN